jgi:hypothetical protein
MQHLNVDLVGDSYRMLDYTIGFKSSESNYCKSQQAADGRSKAVVTATDTLVTIKDPECLNGATVEKVKGMSFMDMADPIAVKEGNVAVQSPAVDTSGAYLEVVGTYHAILHRPAGGLASANQIVISGLEVGNTYYRPSGPYGSNNSYGVAISSWTDTAIDIVDPQGFAGSPILRKVYADGIGWFDIQNVSMPDPNPVVLDSVEASADGLQITLRGQNLTHVGRFEISNTEYGQLRLSKAYVYQNATVFTDTEITFSRSLMTWSGEIRQAFDLNHIWMSSSNGGSGVTLVDKDISVHVPAMDQSNLPDLASSPAKGTLHLSTDMTGIGAIQLDVVYRLYKPGSANASQNPADIQITQWDANGLTLVAPITLARLYVGAMWVYDANGSSFNCSFCTINNRVDFRPVTIQTDPIAISSVVSSPSDGQLVISGTGLDQVSGVEITLSSGKLRVYNPNGSGASQVLTADGASVTFTANEIRITSMDDLSQMAVSKVALENLYGLYQSTAVNPTASL